MSAEYKVHGHVSLVTDDNGDKYRMATVMCEHDGDSVSLWFDSIDFGVKLTLTPAQAKGIAELLKAVTP